MSRTSVIFGVLVLGFVVFITIKGELGQYIGTLKGTASAV